MFLQLCGDGAWGGASMPRHLKRHKREWVVPAQKLKENFDYTDRKYVAIVRLLSLFSHSSSSVIVSSEVSFLRSALL